MKFFVSTMLFLSLGLGVSLSSAIADTPAFKCQDNGKIIFSQTPCKSGTSTVIDIKTIRPSEQEQHAAQNAHQQRLKIVSKLEKSRHKDDAKQDAINRHIASQAASARKHCEAKQLQAKWAKEDLKNTQPKAEMKARQKLKRAEEKADLVCKN
ncbi:hypothetical protein [Undibacterium flavidum]|uniref:DUF4124 domain-containing protein n=1 Tax=Undibacterium flavidum TaxID=2762297 RepID=A0ABR6YCW1_9BURK|nr:hypothetical protein [Undibacterium flavidum]MBC3874395.1 hypothetical protein [Undibacterium flavidum]